MDNADIAEVETELVAVRARAWALGQDTLSAARCLLAELRLARALANAASRLIDAHSNGEPVDMTDLIARRDFLVEHYIEQPSPARDGGERRE